MEFEQNKKIEKFGYRAGYLFSYFLFTTILYMLFNFLKKRSLNWPYPYLMGISLGTVLISLVFKRLLK